MAETPTNDSIMSTHVTFPSGAAQLRGYVANPGRAERSPAVIVIHEIWGLMPHIDQVIHIRCPVLGLYGGEDHRITDSVPALTQAMRRAGKAFEYHVYPGAVHAFFNDARATYQPEAAQDAWTRVLSFFDSHLRHR